MSIPVTVLSGYLGAGKTTVLNHVLNQRGDKRIAIIVNDMSEVNIDADLIEKGGFRRTEETFVELSNGCICCTLREDLMVEVKRLAEQGNIDCILIESTGISEPVPVAQTLTFADENLEINLQSYCKLDTMVTVVDAYRFWHDFQSGETLLDREQGNDDSDERSISELLMDQIEFCDVLLLNKCDLLEEKELAKLETVLRKLQPFASIIRTVHGEVELKDILETGKFNMEHASGQQAWQDELEGDLHLPETEEYGITSFVYSRRRPFHSERFNEWCDEYPEEVIRAKGTVWVATRNDLALQLSQAGPHATLHPLAYWIDSLPKAEKVHMLAEHPEVKKKWDPSYGDRINEVVFIGQGMDKATITKELDHCLLTDEEMRSNWSDFRDPYPWNVQTDRNV